METGWLTNPYVMTFLGVVGGYLISFLVPTIKYLKNILRQNIFHGSWREYYLTHKDGESKVVEGKWDISKSFKREMVIESKTLDNSLEDKGFMYNQRNTLVATLKSVIKLHEEDVTCRFYLPIPGSKIIVGLWTGFDHDGKIQSAPIILSKEEIPIEEFWSIIRMQYIIESKNRIIRISQ